MSNIVIIEREEDLQAWLEKRGLTILVRKTNLGWRATFQQQFAVTGVPAGPVSGNDPAQAVTHFVNWLFGAELSLSRAPTGCSTAIPEIVPRFTGIEEAVASAQHSRQEPT
jgi:hypothetical protein